MQEFEQSQTPNESRDDDDVNSGHTDTGPGDDTPDTPPVEVDHSGEPLAGESVEAADDEDEPLVGDEEADEAAAAAARERDTAPAIPPEVVALGISTFDDLPLHPTIAAAVQKIGWKEPTPVQKMCLPFTLRGRDVAGFAQTGTGKTAVFLMTIANHLLAAEGPPPKGPRAIVLAPTRELAMQIEQDAQTVLAETGLRSVAVFGGVDFDKQMKVINEGVDIIFATPGRLIDYIKRKMVSLAEVKVFVCDEADRMFDMGFIEDVEYFLERIPESAQKLLFSATTNEQVKELAFEYLETPEYISVNPEVITPEKIEQHGIHCHATQKLKVLMGLLREHQPVCAIIFTNTKVSAEWLHYKLVNNGMAEADLITGDLPQSKRIRLIHRIKDGTLKLLIATDVASRGLHISRVTHVYNFDLPDEAANYVHRIGRTARAGARGYAYSLVCDDYGQNLAAINELLGPAGFTTEWPKEEYLQIEDKADNPFAGRERVGRFGGSPGGRPDRGPRDRDRGGGRGGDRGPRGDRGGDRGGRGGGRPQRDHAPGGARDDQRHQPQRAGAAAQPEGQGGEGRGGRRRRGRGGRGRGEGQDGQPNQNQNQDRQQAHGRGGRDNQQRGGRGDRHGGPQRDGQRHGGRGRQEHGYQASRGREITSAAPTTFFGILKKFFRTIFGLGK